MLSRHCAQITQYTALFNTLLEAGTECSRTSERYVLTTGKVTNVGPIPLEDVKAVVLFYARDGTAFRDGRIFSSDAAPLSKPKLKPGESSTFRIASDFDPAMGQCMIFLSYGDGEPGPTSRP